MNSKGLLIFFAIPVLTIVTLLFINNAAFLGGVEQNRINEIKQQQDAANSPTNGNAPLPNDTDFINMFFQTLQEKNTATSLAMMAFTSETSEAEIKEWEKYLTSFKKAEVKNIEPANKSTWTDTKHFFKVTANVEMEPEAANAKIPNYGWQNGDNIKWIELAKGADGLWRVSEIATGP